VSDSNSIAVLERTSLNVYGADIFNCSRHYTLGLGGQNHTKSDWQEEIRTVTDAHWTAGGLRANGELTMASVARY
jgi:hypothetical protein